MQHYDVAIAGAGPAGSALARRLALRGCRVVLIERSRYAEARIGESLAPAIKPLLQELDAWDHFQGLRPLPSWGVHAHWGAAESAQTHSHLFSPHACGWHIDRCAFDRMLAQRAVDAGALLLQGTAVQGATAQGESWHVELRQERALAPTAISACVVVDATGRRAHLARRLGAIRFAFDRLVGVAAHLRVHDPDARAHLRVETNEWGWWYFAPLPDSAAPATPTTLAMLMTDADLCAAAGLHRTDGWRSLLRDTAFLRGGFCDAEPLSALRTHCAASHRVRRQVSAMDAPWLSVGDASLAVDPVSGSGVLRALRSARAATDVVLAQLNRRASVEGYELERDRECTEFLFERAAYYGYEERWPEASFWRRRALRQGDR